jgi:hypothetical protein
VLERFRASGCEPEHRGTALDRSPAYAQPTPGVDLSELAPRGGLGLDSTSDGNHAERSWPPAYCRRALQHEIATRLAISREAIGPPGEALVSLAKANGLGSESARARGEGCGIETARTDHTAVAR